MDRRAAESALSKQLTLFDEPPTSGPVTRRLLRVGARIVGYRFTRSRRRTIGISVDASGLAVRAPLRASWRDIEAFLHEKEGWILARLDEWAGAGSPHPLFGVTGESLPLFGERVVLQVEAGRRGVRHEGARLHVTLREPQRHGTVRMLLVRWLKATALEVLAPRSEHYAAQLGLAAPPVAVSHAKTQWGACTASGAIRLSWRLVYLAPALADYVVAHEVAHLVELNHSRRFWAVVERLYPEWRTAREAIELAAASLPIL